jgi:hypothetical protein
MVGGLKLPQATSTQGGEGPAHPVLWQANFSTGMLGALDACFAWAAGPDAQTAQASGTETQDARSMQDIQQEEC